MSTVQHVAGSPRVPEHDSTSKALQTAADQSPSEPPAPHTLVKAAMPCHDSYMSALLHPSEASAVPENAAHAAVPPHALADALERPRRRFPGWLKLVASLN